MSFANDGKLCLRRGKREYSINCVKNYFDDTNVLLENSGTTHITNLIPTIP